MKQQTTLLLIVFLLFGWNLTYSQDSNKLREKKPTSGYIPVFKDGNVIEQHNINNKHTSIIYAYDNKYPVIVANNSTYDDLKTASDIALNAAGFNSFEEITTLSTEQQRSKWNAFNENLRNHLSNSELSTYSYIPLVGMSSEVDWNNKVTYYQYDRLQRLETVRDSDYNVLKHVDIEYK